MTYKDNRLFDFINYVLKIKQDAPRNYLPPIFMVNRWLSMGHSAFPKIINLTTNRWCRKVDNFDIEKFYYVFFPKYTNRLSYIKKKVKEKDVSDSKNLANLMECSTREIEIFDNLVAQLNICDK